ncbi:MAG: hypothetical protein IKW12_03630 [Clostridia bacterium]|nr:hypothetical protein [Clostridia bacterium]
MTEFDKFREAAEEIKLDDLQKQKILEACKGKKRRRINYTALAAAAACLVITVAVFSPGFYLKAGAPADMAENEAAAEDIFLADQDVNYYSAQSDSLSGGADLKNDTALIVEDWAWSIFDAEGFRSIYSVIPQSFVSLVDEVEFAEWSETVSAEDGMAIVQFVERFNISKEAFDEVNRDYARRINSVYGVLPVYFTPFEEHEIYEIFNTELIYSFDREAIDEYYIAMPKRESGMGSNPAEMIVPEEYYK